VKFFLDNCISPVIAEAVQLLASQQGDTVVHLIARFPADTKDPVWLRALGAEGGWIIVSGDHRISTGKAERAAWHESGLTAFFFASGFTSQRFWTQAAEVVRWWPIVRRVAQEAHTGSGFMLPMRAKDPQAIYRPG